MRQFIDHKEGCTEPNFYDKKATWEDNKTYKLHQIILLSICCFEYMVMLMLILKQCLLHSIVGKY